MRLKYFPTIIIALLLNADIFALGEASGNALYAEHFAQVRCRIDGGVGGPAKQASLNSNYMTSDSAGNVYFASVGENKVYWMNPAGVVSPIAGSGVLGYKDGPGEEACFLMGDGQYGSSLIHCDNYGNVYLADRSRLRKIYRLPDSTWMVTTVVGGVSNAYPEVGEWRAANLCSFDASNFALSRDGTEAYWAGWRGFQKVKINGNNASENRVTLLVQTTNSEYRMWKSGAYATTDSQVYWMPLDPHTIKRYDERTGLVDHYSGNKDGTSHAAYDGTSRFDAGFWTVQLVVSPSGGTMFTGGGDESYMRRIYQDTVKHLMADGSLVRMNGGGNWIGSVQNIDYNGYFYYTAGNSVNGGFDLTARMVFEGTDTSAGSVKGGIKVVLVDSATQQRVTTYATVELKQGDVVVGKEPTGSGAAYLYGAAGHYTVSVNAPTYYPKEIAVDLVSGQMGNILVQCSRAPIQSIEIQPRPVSMPASFNKQLAIFCKYIGGSKLLLDSTLAAEWTSRVPSLVSVNNAGLLTSGAQEGSGFIVAAIPSLGLVDSCEVTVLSAYKLPIYYWNLNEDNGPTALDVSANGNTATLQDSPIRASGYYGNGLTFDGINDYLSTSLQVTSPNLFTMAFWFKTTAATNGGMMGFVSSQTGGGGSWDRIIRISSNGKVAFSCWTGSETVINSTDSYNDGAWHHAAATMSNNGILLYIDGALVAGNANVRSAAAYNGYWRIGNDNSTYFNGQLDDIRMYDLALSPAEIALLISDTTTLATPDENPASLMDKPELSASPNPFNPSVTLRVTGWSSRSELKIVDISGRVVADLSPVLNNRISDERSVQATWNASGFASGVYVVLLKNGTSELKRKVILAR